MMLNTLCSLSYWHVTITKMKAKQGYCINIITKTINAIGKNMKLNIQNNISYHGDMIPVEELKRGKRSLWWEGHCEWCGAFISKRWCQCKNSAHHFCSKSCSQKYAIRHLSDETKQKMSAAQKVAAIKYKLVKIKSHSNSNSILQNIRKAKGMSQIELAAVVGISQSYLSALENGKENLNEKMVKKLESI